MVERVNWQRVITELNDSGVSTNKIANTLDVRWYTVRHWRDHNGEPRHDDGQRLMLLYDRHVLRPALQTSMIVIHEAALKTCLLFANIQTT